MHKTSLGIEIENTERCKLPKEIQLNQIEGRYQGTNWTCLHCGIAYKTPELLVCADPAKQEKNPNSLFLFVLSANTNEILNKVPDT